MINAYRRLARTFEELNLGGLGPWTKPIPGSLHPPRVGSRVGKTRQSVR
jgi:hypothetical protein